MEIAVLVANLIVLLYFIVLNTIYLGLLFVSYWAVLRYRRSIEFEYWRRVIQSPMSPPVSIIAPAHDEALTIAESVKSLLQLRYPSFEVIVVNDGSKDGTLEVLSSTFHLHRIPMVVVEKVGCQAMLGVYRSPTHPNLVVVDKLNGGKADSLNAGINVSRYPLFCAIDADSLIEGVALLRVTRPFLDRPKTCVAAGGIIRVANGCRIEAGQVTEVRMPRSWLASFQAVEYLRAFLFGRMGWSAMHGLLIISGAFGIFRKDVVIEAGGYRHDTVGEDVELVVRLHRYLRETGRKYEMHFLPDPVCWTEVPESVKVLERQRNRWQRGLTDTLMRHRTMFLNPRYGSIGLVAFPYFVFFEMLSPVVELAGYIIVPLSFLFGLLNFDFFLLLLAVAILLGVTLSTGSVVLEELSFRRYPRARDLARLVVAGLLENFGYRQLHCWWRFKGLCDYLLGSTTWGRMERKGFALEND